MTTGQAVPGIAPLDDGQQRPPGQRLSSWAWPWAVVEATVVWSLWELRATLLPAQFLDDSSVHEQMVRFATAKFSAGQDPLTSWFPYLGLGSPQFLHYQSLPAMLTGLVGLVTGPDVAFRWSLYLLWCLWPVAIFFSARLFRLPPWVAAFAAVVAPLLHSFNSASTTFGQIPNTGIGYEQNAYLWVGYGVWTQLFASWALPFAWALTWRALEDRRFLPWAAGLIGLTAALHFETGFLAFGAVLVLPFCIFEGLRARLARAAVLLGSALLVAAWVVVPLLVYARWAGINQALQTTPLVRGWGARTILEWLFTGRVFDTGHWPVISILVAAGAVVAIWRWRPEPVSRALIVLCAMGLVLSFGRTTFGSLATAMPGGSDVFFRRFLMGAQLAAIFLAGLGAYEFSQRGTGLARTLARLLERAGDGLLGRSGLGWLRWAPAGLLVAVGLVYLTPAWTYLDSYDSWNSSEIHIQVDAQQSELGAASAAAYVNSHGNGRVYAGSLSNWGNTFTVGAVQVYKYLESFDTDEVGYTLRTASLMTQPENRFQSTNPGDYALFGIRYLMMPTYEHPPAGAKLIFQRDQIRLYELPGNGYFRVVDTVGTVAANRADVGTQTLAYLRSPLPGQGRYWTVAYDGAPAARPTLAAGAHPRAVAGSVLGQRVDLADGRASTRVHLNRRAVVVLSASYDPGWQVTVDGRPAVTEMVAPALVAVTVPAGTHTVAFTYQGFGGYPWLFALAIATLAGLAVLTRPGRRLWPSRGGAGVPQEAGVGSAVDAGHADPDNQDPGIP